jgi:hypothetical protein
MNAGEDAGKIEPSHTISENVNYATTMKNYYGGSSKN